VPRLPLTGAFHALGLASIGEYVEAENGNGAEALDRRLPACRRAVCRKAAKLSGMSHSSPA
jgi:hypothetical protein